MTGADPFEDAYGTGIDSALTRATASDPWCRSFEWR